MIVLGLALRGQAPRIFTYCTRHGLPLISVITCVSFCIVPVESISFIGLKSGASLLAFMSLSHSSLTVFNWFVNLTTTGGYGAWFCKPLLVLISLETDNVISHQSRIYRHV